MEYTWPSLDKAIIIKCLQELNISVTDEQLRHPDKTTVNFIYTVLAQFLTGTSSEELEMIDTEARRHLSIPELHSAAVAEISRIQMISRLMGAIGVRNFSWWNDLIFPSRARTIHILSGVINFAMFREQKLSQYNELMVQQSQLYEQRDELAESRTSLEMQRNRLQQEIDQDHQIHAQLQREVGELNELVQELSSRQQGLQLEVSELNQRNQVIREQAVALKQETTAVRARVATLRAHLLEQPEKLQQALLFVETSLVHERTAAAAAERKRQLLAARLSLLLKLEKDTEDCLQLMEQTTAEMSRSRKSRSELKHLHAHLLQLKELQAESEKTAALLLRQIEASDDATSKLEQQLNQLREQQREKIRAAREETDRVNRDRREGTSASRLRQIESEIDTHRRSLFDDEKNFSRLVATASTRMQHLLSQIDSFHHRLSISLQSPALYSF